MFECQICGLLSLGGTACPACGSQLRTDLASTMPSDEVLPTEVPGLDDAAAAWYDLEGIEPPADEEEAVLDTPTPAKGSLPFGFQGTSNVFDSRLPFGIGSFAEGIPFDASQQPPPQHLPHTVVAVEETTDMSIQHDPSEASESAPLEAATPISTPSPLLVEDQAAEPAESVPFVAEMPDLPPVVDGFQSMDSEVLFEEPAAEPAAVVEPQPVRLSAARLVQPGESVVHEPPSVDVDAGVPDYWKIDAAIPDYEEIYDQSETVVEMEYGSLSEDVVVFDHATDSPAAVFHSPLEASPVSVAQPSIKLSLHPAQALAVDVGGSAELQSLVNDGFAAMQQGSWSQAARSFQRLAASLPTSPEVFNNYGVSLLQRAVSMRDGGDEQQRSMADTQFESAILALREAAKSAPANGDVLVNLGITLIESGRAEKALGIMNVHNARVPGSAKGLNTAGVAMFHLGQLTQAVETFGHAGDDAVASENLAQLAPNQG
ncbi:MAG: hypothetical protein QF531_06000 [Candidatus Poseidonia sp.]|nr:hypothetical protein [Poseidonia sp.]